MATSKLRAILDAAPDAIIVLDEAGRIEDANPATGLLFGHRPAELRGASAELLVPGGLAEAALGDGPRPEWPAVAGLERLGRRKDGTEVPIEIRLGATGDGLVVCIIRDVGERRRIQEERDRFFRLSVDMLCVAGVDGYFKRLNPAWQRTLGYSLDELMAVPFLHFVHPDDREATLGETRRLSAGGDTVAFENRYRCKDGSYKWILWNSTPFLREGLIFAVAHDITDRKQAEGQLRLQNLRLQEIARSERQAHEALKQAEVQLVQAEKLSALGQMVAGVAHEINNPLAFVSNNIAVLRRDFAALRELIGLYQQCDDLLAEHLPEALDRIRVLADRIDLAYVLENVESVVTRSRDGLKRIQGIVKGLRDFARLDTSDLGEVDLNESLRPTANIIAGRAEQQGVEVAIDLAELAPITCYPGKINQVVLNLLTNALDACPDGGRVTLRTRPSADGVEIHVIDTGSGIEPGIRDKIFDPFFTTKPVGKGTGLGLSISYGIVREHGGTITVDSIPGRGTHFIVSLPSTPREAGPSPTPTIPMSRRGLGS